MKSRKKSSLSPFFPLVLIFILAGGINGFVRAEEEVLPREVIFSFIEALPRARAFRGEKLQEYKGAWSEDRFHFEGLPGLTDIFVSASTVVDGRARQTIWFQPLNGSESRLVYPNVPPGAKLILSFAIPDLFVRPKKTTPVELEVWIGKKLLYETRVSGKGWRERAFDLTLPYLLGRKCQVAFHIRVSGKEPAGFVFYGRVE